MSEIERELREAGAVFVRQNKHRIFRLNGRIITVSVSPSDKRALNNIRRDIARAMRG